MNMTIAEMSATIEEAKSTLIGAQFAMQQGTRRIHELETCLNRFIAAHENLLSDTEGRYPPADPGCIDCTSGCVPDKYNTGPCPYHTAKRLLGQI